MKRILLLLFSLITTAAIGQYPINQILSSDSTMVSVGRNATGGIRGGLVNMVFADTTAANLSRISYYTGAQIWTTTDSAIWVRFKGTPSFWVKMAGASGGTTGSFWNITGNYFGGGVPLNYGVGTNSYDYLPLKTNNITRLLIPPDGILRSSAPANKYLMMDTTTLEMYYGDGGGGSGWSLTGNAGTTSSNFIGTTDDQPLSFRVNNTWAGSIGKSSGGTYLGIRAGENDNAENEPNVGVGYYALYYNTTGSANSAVGASALASNTTGSRNSAVGVDALSSNTTGYDNSAVGGFVLGTNTTGYYNSAVGVSALYSNTTGSYNSVVGIAALASNTTGDYNSAVGNSAGWNIKQKPDAKYQTLLGSSTYGTRDSISVIGANFIKETIVRGKLIDSTLSAGAGTKAVRWNEATGEFTYADTTAGGGGGGWSLTGNAGTNPASNFIGTTDGQPLMFRYNNLNAGSIGKSSGGTYLGIGAGENDNAEDEPNVGVGYNALYNNTTGSANSAVGASALASNTTGSGNSAVGGVALYNNTTGNVNSAVGANALSSNTTGEANSAVGVDALRSNTTGYYNSAVGASAGWNIKQKPDAKYQNLFGANTYGTRDSITVLGADFIKETIVRGKLIDSTLSAGAGTKAVRWNSSTGEFTYADTTAGGATPAGSNKQVQYNNSGAFGGATGVEIGNTNERLTVTSQSTSESAIVAKNEGGSGHVGISIENSNTNNPYSPLLTFTSNTTSNTRTSKIGLDYGKLMIEGSAEPYQTTEYSLVRFGNFYAGLGNVDIHNYLYATPSSPNNWTMKVRTPSTSSSGLAIEWGATGQTANLLELRDNSSTILSSFDKDGKLYLGSSSAPTTTLQVSGNMAANQGADVASANNLAVVANTTEITGTTQVNLIANTGWVNGSQITLLLASGITIKNGQTTSGSNITILLDGAADFVTSAASSLTLLLCEVGGTQAWREISRRSY